MTETTEELDALPEGRGAPPAAADPAQRAVAWLRALPRPVQPAQIAGFLSVCRAHPLLSAALDYASRKEEQAQRAEQRLEQQFWGEVRAFLLELRPASREAGAAGDRAAGRQALALAQHLAAENLLRMAQAEEARRAPAGRRGRGPTRSTAGGGGERG